MFQEGCIRIQLKRYQFVEDRVGVHEETYTAVFCFAGA